MSVKELLGVIVYEVFTRNDGATLFLQGKTPINLTAKALELYCLDYNTKNRCRCELEKRGQVIGVITNAVITDEAIYIMTSNGELSINCPHGCKPVYMLRTEEGVMLTNIGGLI